MGEQRANDILWKGVTFSAADALEAKLIHEVVPSEQLLAIALAHCEKLAALPPGASELTRTIIRENLVEKLHQVNIEECDILEKKWVSKECFAALAAYLESRKMYSAALLLRSVHWYVRCD